MQIICGCCGKWHDDTPEENADFYERGQDKGFGHCNACYGEGGATEKFSTFQDIQDAFDRGGEDAVEKMMGWANWNFYRARFGTMKAALNEENAAKFDALPIWKKCSLIADAVTDGLMF